MFERGNHRAVDLIEGGHDGAPTAHELAEDLAQMMPSRRLFRNGLDVGLVQDAREQRWHFEPGRRRGHSRQLAEMRRVETAFERVHRPLRPQPTIEVSGEEEPAARDVEDRVHVRRVVRPLPDDIFHTDRPPAAASTARAPHATAGGHARLPSRRSTPVTPDPSSREPDPLSNENQLRRLPTLLGLLAGSGLSLLVSRLAPEAELAASGMSRGSLGALALLFLAPLGILFGNTIAMSIRNARRAPILWRVWAGFALFFTIVILLESLNDKGESERYAREGRSVPATVLGSYPHDHNTLEVRYVVAGRTYQHRIYASGRAEDFKAGDSVTVHYFASEPEGAFGRRPDWELSGAVVSWVVAAGLLPTFLVGVGGGMMLRRSDGLGGPPSS